MSYRRVLVFCMEIRQAQNTRHENIQSRIACTRSPGYPGDGENRYVVIVFDLIAEDS